MSLQQDYLHCNSKHCNVIKELHNNNSNKTLGFEPAQCKESNNQLSVMYLCCYDKVGGKFLYIPCRKHIQLLLVAKHFGLIVPLQTTLRAKSLCTFQWEIQKIFTKPKTSSFHVLPFHHVKSNNTLRQIYGTTFCFHFSKLNIGMNLKFVAFSL